MQHYYKSEDPTVVGIVQEYFRARDDFQVQLKALGTAFGGAAAPMRDHDSHFAGGIKLSDDRALDVHWKRPDEHGYRGLRASASMPKGLSKEERNGLRDEHLRLWTKWDDFCPERLSITDYWDRLGINTGNLWLCGGVKFEHQGTAYFTLGFDINHKDHLAKVSAGEPSAGWIDGAVEILPSEYETARLAKVGGAA